jgi:hypothetical protein
MITMITTLKPSTKALDKARKLVTKSDRWMTPTLDASKEGKKDYATYEIEEIEGWEQTGHFTLRYRELLTDIGYDDAYAQGFDESDYIEPGLAFHEMFLVPLKEAFWEAWTEKHKLYEFWKQNING